MASKYTKSLIEINEAVHISEVNCLSVFRECQLIFIISSLISQ